MHKIIHLIVKPARLPSCIVQVTQYDTVKYNIVFIESLEAANRYCVKQTNRSPLIHVNSFITDKMC